MPIASPAQLQVRDGNLTPAFIPIIEFQSDDEEKVCAAFHQKMGATRELLGAKLFATLLVDLNSAGFDASLFDGVTPPPNILDSSDERRSSSPEAVLRVTFADAGMATRLWSSSYEPRVNVSTYLEAIPHSADGLASDYFYYGVDSSGDTAWSMPADPEYRFASVHAMLENPDRVAEGYDVAIRTLSKRIVARVCAQS